MFKISMQGKFLYVDSLHKRGILIRYIVIGYLLLELKTPLISIEAVLVLIFSKPLTARMECVDHLLVECPYDNSIRYKIFRWCGLQKITTNFVDELLQFVAY
uniref:Uncharacterized protein n=1 Tax=Lactuca sativa TaxID=4236 RepID=A0A9R1WXV4_LACSA|nr:hypothetical protein LSAT_V11C800412940 [Lactuca sativa]